MWPVPHTGGPVSPAWAGVAPLGVRGVDVAGQRQARRLRRHPGGRRNVVKVLMTDAEAAAVRDRAAQVGVSVPRLLVESALAGDARTVSERHALVEEFLGARRLVAAVSRNLNQLTVGLHSTGRARPELETALHAAARTLARLDGAVEDLW